MPVYPQVLQSIGEMAQMRLDVCAKLPADHPFQPSFIQPLQTIPVDVEFVNEQAVPEPNIPETSSSQPQPSTQFCESNLEEASELAFDEVTLESLQQQEPNLEMASNNCTELIIHPEYQPYCNVLIFNFLLFFYYYYYYYYFFIQKCMLVINLLNVIIEDERDFF